MKEEITRFDLEQAIMECWGTEQDIELISDSISDCDLQDNSIDVDDILNALIGLQRLHKLRCTKLYDIFSTLIEKRQIT